MKNPVRSDVNAGAVTALLGFRLALAGGREGLARIVLTGLGVALGVAFVLSALAGGSALQGRAERSAWQNTLDASQSGVPTRVEAAPDPALWLAVSDHYAGRPVHRVHVAALGPRPPVPPGLDRLPGPGEVAVSPELRRLLAVTPSDRLGDRFPGRVTMTIGSEGLRHPDHLVAVVGHTPEELRRWGADEEVRGIATRSLDLFPLLRIALFAGAIVLLFPIMVFIVMVTMIAAARREQRLAAMRMVGATKLQIAAIAAAESLLGAAAGAVAGLLAFLALRPALASIRYGDYQGGRFFVEDLTVPAQQIAAVMAAVPALAVCTAVFASHRARITPLGVGAGRRVPGPPPGAWRVLPALGGVAVLSVIAVALRNDPDVARRTWVGPAANLALLCTLAGAAISGPWVCYVAGRAMARYGRKVTTLMAARRIVSAPRATYRAVGGVALAVYIATLFAGTVGIAATGTPGERLGFDGRQRPGVVEIYAGGEPETTLAPLMSDGVVVARRGPGRRVSVACTELARVVDVRCPYPKNLLETRFPDSSAMGLWATGGDVVEPGPGAAALPVHALYVPTDGSEAAVERLRTRVATLMPRAIVSTRDDDFRQQSDLSGLFGDVSAGMRMVMLFVVLVAGCSLTISVINGLIERRRPFAFLRASGVRIGELRRVTLLETAVPMVLTVALGGLLGSVPVLATAVATGMPYAGPGLDFAAHLAGVVLVSLAITTLAFPLMKAATRYDAIRFE
ncbi:FtsX-like permease family protein [Actinomadura sp. SCN-SB]|uniref:FtsX-like permease family protein n=1 Tax=Actinomadura sp. SCN-SB TaxID=3373092 RepID=UPI003751EDEC